jgi:[ribosomal protein S5]-alanine N-acetyltransferase
MHDFLPRQSGRIQLRRLSAADLTPFQAYRTDIEVGRYQGWSVMSSAEAQAFLSEMAGAPLFLPDLWCQLAIADGLSGRLIGDIGVCVRSTEPCAEIGFTLAPASQGQGLGTEAVGAALELIFALTLVARVIATTDARNLPSVQLLKRVGMQLQQSIQTTFRGEPCIELVFEARNATLAA